MVSIHHLGETINSRLGPRDQGPGTRGHRVCVALLQLKCKYTGYQCQCYVPITHGYVLYVVAMHTEGIIYSRQRYFKLFSDFFDPQSSLLSVLQSQTCTHKWRESRDFLHLTFLTPEPQPE